MKLVTVSLMIILYMIVYTLYIKSNLCKITQELSGEKPE
jgi:hypothetical protein